MAAISFKTKIRKDGTLAMPKAARDTLQLQPGDEVEVQVHTVAEPVESTARNPLLGVMNLGKAGKSDGAENHDSYLYGKDPL